MLAAIFALVIAPQEVRVSTDAELQNALKNARPGVTILIAPGDYQGGIFQSNLQGTAEKPITIANEHPYLFPTFKGGNGIHFSKPSYLKIRNINIKDVKANGLNIDDDGSPSTPANHIEISGLTVFNTPVGNNDAIKLSGVQDFSIEDCLIGKWGGSGIDMVGCHNGVIKNSVLSSGGDNAIQLKGGTSNVTIERCRFKDAGQRTINIGGSTGREFFRPPLDSIPAGQRVEAKNITVQGCTMLGATASIAMVGCTNSTVRFNTIYKPLKWAFRILQESREQDFIPCGNNKVDSNLILFNSDKWSENGINVGSGTNPKSILFSNNFWFCIDKPGTEKPNSNIIESSEIRGKDPQHKLSDFDIDIYVNPKGPATKVGAHAFPVKP